MGSKETPRFTTVKPFNIPSGMKINWYYRVNCPGQAMYRVKEGNVEVTKLFNCGADVPEGEAPPKMIEQADNPNFVVHDKDGILRFKIEKIPRMERTNDGSGDSSIRTVIKGDGSMVTIGDSNLTAVADTQSLSKVVLDSLSDEAAKRKKRQVVVDEDDEDDED